MEELGQKQAHEPIDERIADADVEKVEEPEGLDLNAPWPFPQKISCNDPENARRVVSWMNNRYFALPVGSRFRIGMEEFDAIDGKSDFKVMKRDDFINSLSNRRVIFGTKEMSAAEFWLLNENRRQYKGIKFAPKTETEGYYNYWRGFAVEPREGDCSLYLDHVQNIIAAGNEQISRYILDWMAHTVQCPWDLIGTAIILRGKQGTGKGVFANGFGSLFGPHYTHISQPGHLTGRFNSHMKHCVVIFCDEAQWGTGSKGEGVLKALVTEPTLQIEGKGQDVIELRNHVHLIAATNNDLAVPVGLEERRFLIVDVSSTRIQDHDYFNRIEEQLNNGGREALLHYLANRTYDKNTLRKFPHTRALFETKILSISPVHKFWYERLHAGALTARRDNWGDGKIETAILQREYQNFCKASGLSAKATSTELGISLRKLLPEDLRKERRTVDNVRRIFYVFPPLLECRQSFCRALQTEIDWPEGGYAVAV